MRAFLRSRRRGQEKITHTRLRKSATKMAYRLTRFKDNHFRSDHLTEGTSCTIDFRRKALVIKGDFPHLGNIIKLYAEEIESITLIRGKQVINTFRMSPVHLLTKIGVSDRLTRHFVLSPDEFVTKETKIIVKTKSGLVEISCNGHLFNRVQRALKAAQFGAKLDVVKEPIYKTVDNNPEIYI